MQKKYNIGLDIGTTSVGWAVVEAETAQIMKRGSKALWGVRLFEGASTAVERRNYRSTRRKYDRRRERIKLLQEEFNEEIEKIDPNFYQKLKESKFNIIDSLNKTILITDDEKKLIKEYNKKYSTIYHLRNKLINNPEKEDIRLVYLAIHHIIKYRGNFSYNINNFNMNSLNLIDKLDEVFKSFEEIIPEFNLPIKEQLVDIENILMDDSKNDIKKNISTKLLDLSDNKKFSNAFAKMIVGNKFDIADILFEQELDVKKSISFTGSELEDNQIELETIFGTKIELLNQLKELYDLLFLKKIFKGEEDASLSSLMVKKYNIHKDDLRYLKETFKKNYPLYKELFKDDQCLYIKYLHNILSYDDFIKELKKKFATLFDNLEESYDNSFILKYKEIEKRMDNNEFLPKITETENGKFPYQLNEVELIKIIENQGKYYPFLLNKINDEYKLVKLLNFRIPYYVGPLVSSNKSVNAWLERKVNNVKITPYNFSEVVDKEKTAERFIKKMISHCTYLLEEYALPNNSLLYSKYKVMNELKQIKINGEKLNNEIQHKIIKELFMKNSGSITNKKFKEYLHSTGLFEMYDDINITGYSADEKFANNLQSYIDFFGNNGIFEGTTYSEDAAEEIIEWVTIFKDKDILESKLRNKYTELTDKEIKIVLSKKYSGWGSLSKKLLITKYYKDEKTGIYKSIIDLMEETEENFMQIINNDKYKFQQMIKKNNKYLKSNKLTYDVVGSLATSPATRKGIYQALQVVEEIIDYMQYEPENISIEMAREEEKKERKDSRKNQLINLYTQFKNDIKNYEQLWSELNNIDEKEMTQKIFLYFIQEGKCLYSQEPIIIENINSDDYEIDHIIPRSIVKDDSIDNKALVLRKYNQEKKDSLVLPISYINKNIVWWQKLRKLNLISAKKFYRLTRKEYKEEDIQEFINRQLVETRQITKHVANIISNLHKDSKVIYLKASLSHNYREKFELFKYRDLNDYHHAHDAYLAAVLGEYEEKYMKNKINYNMLQALNNKFRELKDYKKLKWGFVINSLDEEASDIVNQITQNLVNQETGEVGFKVHEFNKTIADTLYRNDILISKKTEIRTGALFKMTINPRGKGHVAIKKGMDPDLYGGYTSVECSYITLVEYKDKRKMIGIPVSVAIESKKNKNVKINYLKQQLNLKEDLNIKILKDKIPFETLINYQGQDVYIKGYGMVNKNFEISNACQLKLSKDNLIKWKYVLNKIFNRKAIPVVDNKPLLSEDEERKQLIDILTILYSKKQKFPLFKSAIEKIEVGIKVDNLDNDQIIKVIREIFTLYKCNSVNANLKEFGLGDRIGRLCISTITSGTIINKSVTGIKESKYEF